MQTEKPSYLSIETTRKTVTVEFDHMVEVRSSATALVDYPSPDADLTGVHVSVGPMSMTLSTTEALNIATALTEAALFYREKKAAALEHYEALAREAQQETA